MITAENLKQRDHYLNELISFQDKEPVKIITGIRRCGKSSLMKLMARHLINSGISSEQIIDMNFESFQFQDMSNSALYQYVKEHSVNNKRMYLFFDELQKIDGWEKTINAFRVDLDCDIYITGSNAYLLSSEYATYLSGRCVEVKMLPLSFREFLDFHDYSIVQSKNELGTFMHAENKQGVSFALRDLFNSYLRLGGMPGVAAAGFDQKMSLMLLQEIYDTVIVRDILAREKRRGQSQITDSVLLTKITRFLADSIGSNISVSSIGNVLVNEGLLDSRHRKSTPSAHTVQTYVNALLESYFFYEIKRFDIKGKEYLRTLGKYYIVDPGLRNLLLGFRDRDSGHILENIVYLELLRRGYDVSIGKTDSFEIDFIAQTADRKMYIQVTESMLSEDVRSRELTPLRRINDNYEKMILSLEPGLDPEYDGIISKNLIDWLVAAQ